jgi:hypothetical protein
MSVRAAVLACVVGAVCAGGAGLVWAQQGAAPRLDSTEIVFDASVPSALEVKRAPTGHLLVRPVVNGIDAGWFIFDTGAGICCVSTPHVERLGLRESGSVDSVGVGGSQSSTLVTAESVRLGPATVADHVLMVTDLAFLKQHLGEEIVGVIGYGILSKCVVEMDLHHGRIGVHDPAEAVVADLAWTELMIGDRVPAVRARFEDREGVFRLDTGANGHVTFHQPAVKKWDLLADRAVTDARLGGVGGFVAAKQGTVAWFEIGGVRTEDVPAKFAIEAKGTFADAKKDGNIGVELLRPFVLWFDYAGERMAFVKRGE